VISILWALISAALYGTGAAFQQRQAASAPDTAAGRPTLLLLLIRRPWWLLGVAGELGGFATHAIALHSGPLTVVQMLLASSLVFSVATVRLSSGRRLGWTTWAAALAVVAGIGSFVALASPGLPDAHGLPPRTGLAAAFLAVAAAPFVLGGLTSAGRRRAVLLAVGAGLADACVAVVTMTFSHAVSHGLAGVAGSWATYALAFGGPCSMLLTQTAYQTGRPMITLPIVTVVTPMASLAAGVGLLGETARLSGASGFVILLAVLVTATGLVTLARRTSAQPEPAPARIPAPGRGSVPGPAPEAARGAVAARGAAAVRGVVAAAGRHVGPVAKQVLAATFSPAIGNMPFWMLP
jgi:drug/metabolite transporter (DMT)-like permease